MDDGRLTVDDGKSDAVGSSSRRSTSTGAIRLLVAVAILLILAIRLAAPGSDPYRRLDWDTGILTDEGFYSLNARNLVLFGHARLDEFNNMLVAPLVHWAQVA